MVAANVVREFQIGNTRIRIADNYCKKTASEVERLLQRIAQQAQRQFNAAAAAGIYEQEQDAEIPADGRNAFDGGDHAGSGGQYDSRRCASTGERPAKGQIRVTGDGDTES